LKGDSFLPSSSVLHFGENANTRKVKWSSSDPEVADVNDKEEIVCHKIGYADLTATLEGTDISQSIKINVIDANFSFDPGTGLITGYEPGSLQGAVLAIPNYIGNVAVKGIGDGAFENCSDFEAVNFHDSCVYVGENAFKGSSLSYAKFNGPVILSDKAFALCSDLATVVSDNDISLTGTSFQDCENLAKIEMPFEKILGKYSNVQWKDYYYYLGSSESRQIIAEECENGKMSTVYGWAEPGTIVSVTAVPDEKYMYSPNTLTLTDTNGEIIPLEKSNGLSFVMPNSDVIIGGKFEVDKNYLEILHVDEGGQPLDFTNTVFSLRDGKDVLLEVYPPVGYEVSKVQYQLQSDDSFMTLQQIDGGAIRIKNVNDAVTVKCVWKKTDYTITFAGLQTDGTHVTSKIHYNDTLPALPDELKPLVEANSSKGDFMGFYTEGNGNGSLMYDAEYVADSAYTHSVPVDITLYPYWKPKTYVISFYSGNTMLSQQVCEYGKFPDRVNVPVNEQEPELRFLSFTTDKGVDYFNSNGQAIRALDVQSDLSLYASWQSGKRNFSLVYQIDTGTEQSVGVQYYQSATTLPPLNLHNVNTYINHEFLGFYEKDEDGNWKDTLYYDKNLIPQDVSPSGLSGKT
ncbi:MAG: leucine-rich repeat protein, partial [Spirochaetaceae bacterium]|nr:leucine-rich repeat protein [Spirochaetaceae bacterium]